MRARSTSDGRRPTADIGNALALVTCGGGDDRYPTSSNFIRMAGYGESAIDTAYRAIAVKVRQIGFDHEKVTNPRTL